MLSQLVLSASETVYSVYNLNFKLATENVHSPAQTAMQFSFTLQLQGVSAGLKKLFVTQTC